jgi:hypothetical protein
MQMRSNDIIKYPKFYNYVSTLLPLVRDRSGIISTITDLSGEIDEEIVRNALIWGNAPMVKVVRTLNFGFYNPKKREEICIRRKWVKEFEKEKGLRITKWGEPVQLVEVILLHELTHWTDDRDRIDHTGPDVEEGNLFEELNYGYVITPRSAERY